MGRIVISLLCVLLQALHDGGDGGFSDPAGR
jgi:hypothetical protein